MVKVDDAKTKPIKAVIEVVDVVENVNEKNNLEKKETPISEIKEEIEKTATIEFVETNVIKEKKRRTTAK